jgi:hypothetical protein
MVGRGGEVPGAATGNAQRRRGLHHPRPELSKPRTRYTYLPGGAEVPEAQAPNIRGRSYTIAAEVGIDAEDAGGVLFSQGSRFGGHALYVKDGKLA